MSFCGLEGKARYGMTPLADVLPVKIMNYDDRIDSPEGVSPVIVDKGHPLVKGIEEPWPRYLGYNYLEERAGHAGGGEVQGLGRARRGRVRQGTVCGDRLRLSAALGASGGPGVEVLPDALEEHHRMAREQVGKARCIDRHKST